MAQLSDSAPRRGAILVVEDRDDVRQGMAQLLEMHGFVVVDASDGERALMHLVAEPRAFALVLLDLVMPGVCSGEELRARQLADPELAAIPTVIVTASEPDPARRARVRPAAWVAKPFRFEELLSVVRRYVAPEAGGGMFGDVLTPAPDGVEAAPGPPPARPPTR